MKTIFWIRGGKETGAWKDQETFEGTIEEGACPFCCVPAVCNLPPWELAKQPDGTTHVCNPAIGGCNQGFAKEDQ